MIIAKKLDLIRKNKKQCIKWQGSNCCVWNIKDLKPSCKNNGITSGYDEVAQKEPKSTPLNQWDAQQLFAFLIPSQVP